MTLSDDSLKQAIASFQTGRLSDAERHFKEVLRHEPKHVAALNLLSVLLTHLGRCAEAEPYIKLALKLNSNSDATFYNYGLILKALNRPNEALERFSQALSINATVAETWNNRGTILNEIERYDDAIANFDKAISLQPNFSGAFCNKGKSLGKLKRYDEAFAAFDKALALKPDLAEAWVGRGNVFNELKRYDEAFAAFDKALALKPDLAEAWLGRGNVFNELKRYDEAFAAYDKALALKPDLAEAWVGRGNVFNELKRYDEAFAAYDKALALKPNLAEAWVGRGNVFNELKRYDEAFAAYDKALALKPDLAEAWVGRGNVFNELKRYDEAFAAYDKALALKPDLAEAWVGRGNVFNELKRYDEAFVAYDKALALKPDLTYAEGARLHSKMQLCDWSNFDAESAHLISSVRSGTQAPPFSLLAICSSLEDQLQNATLYTAKECHLFEKLIWQGERYDHDKIRVAYLSADFCEHPVSFLMTGVFERHDRSRFDVTGISLGPDDNSEIRQRLKATFERFIDAKTFSDEQIANLVRSSEVDILVDLMGFTAGARTGVFARRPAPVQVNYLGYPATMGAEYIDYIIGDRIVIPEDKQEFYEEKIVYLPNSFHPTDQDRRISDKEFLRTDAGLPHEGFVFCCFNANYKITPDVFDIWMRILKKVEDGVLWLVVENPTAKSNLRSEAVTRGVNAERLIFAPRMSLPEHQSRLRLADLFLDTLPYNAGTTASDMLWAGLPVLTRIGDTFVGRMAASVLNAIGLPELITTTLEAYEQMAIDLAMHSEKLAVIKRKLAENRLNTPLFDTKLFTKHIEAAYSIMWERYQRGAPPESFSVDPLEQQLKYQ
jgi:predicted O-linked N-acetylglucosamine transferase (SPINDLY family)